MREQRRWVALALSAAGAFALGACGSEKGAGTTGNPGAQVGAPANVGGSGPAASIPGPTSTGASSQAGIAGAAASMPAAMQAPAVAMPMMQPKGTAGIGGGAGASAPASGTPLMPPTPSTGMKDGDPSKPIVAVPGINCGAPTGGFGFAPANAKITNRDVVIAYPCNKHEGAAVTFILMLHGTMPDESQKLYIVPYFGAVNYVDKDNLIIAAPKAIGSQWGNGDNGQDLPHIYDVINYVYTNFSKLAITSMWVAGHSWGASYAKQLVCDAMIQDRAKGVLSMSGGPFAPQCGDRISQIHTIGEKEIMSGQSDAMVFPDQSKAAVGHGCDMALTGPEMIATNARWYHHANCKPQWVQSDYVSIGKAHADFIDAPEVEHVINAIKATDM